MTNFSFWQRWLFVVGIAVSVFGLYMAFFSGTPLFESFNRQIDPAFWGTNVVENSAREFQSSLPFQKEREMGVELPGCRIARLVRFRYFHLFKLQGVFQCRFQHGSTHLGDITSGVHAEILRLACMNTKPTPADYDA